MQQALLFTEVTHDDRSRHPGTMKKTVSGFAIFASFAVDTAVVKQTESVIKRKARQDREAISIFRAGNEENEEEGAPSFPSFASVK